MPKLQWNWPAGACGWYAILLCSTDFNAAQRWNSANNAGHVINTGSGQFPNFRPGFFCAVIGPVDKGSADAFAAQWRVNGAPTAYVKNAC